ncbi:MAG: hypothetical protein JWL70_660, partial [Acidimicrobiia bacterium]|nr:hypothetical protein [Acidimicrobiia bacterium]
ALIAVAGFATLGAVTASAASLGGITTSSLGASEATVTSCDTDGVTTAFTPAFDNTAGVGKYTHGAVTVSGLNVACVGQTINVRVRNASTGPDTVSSTGTAVIAAASQLVTMTTPIDATVVTGISITVHS